MAKITTTAAQYFRRFNGQAQPYSLEKPPAPSLKLIVVIPAYAEDLEPTLKSLGECDLPKPEKAEVILVINQAQTDIEHSKLHEGQVAQWQNQRLQNGLSVQALGALDLPVKQAGVGLARKIGMDAALQRFASIAHDGFIVCLDADCTVSTNYLEGLLEQEQQAKIIGLSLQYRHLFEELPQMERQRIVNYEIWLRYYHEALRWSGYRHHFQTVGSSMLCRASAYAKVGGMNKRKAGEDFYFLHKLMPLGNYGACNEVQVYPSARISTRVPFGTGRAMLEQEEEKKDFQKLYNPAIFQELQLLHASLPELYEERHQMGFWSEFLANDPKLESSFRQLLKRSSDYQQFEKSFWHWWNGFNALKFVHHRSAIFPKVAPGQAFSFLFEEVPEGENLLLALRKLENERGRLYFW